MPTEDEGYQGGYGHSSGLNSVNSNPQGQMSLSIPRSPGTVAPAPAPFIVREQARDGNCLFRSFSDQIYGTPEHHRLVRERCAEYIASERSYFEQFIAEPFADFIARIQRQGEWGDDVEIEALSEIYDCRVEIYASYTHQRIRTFHEACDAKWARPIQLQYEGSAHYNSLAPRSGLVPVVRMMPVSQAGEIEDAAIARSRRRREAGERRHGCGETDVELTDREVLDNSIHLSRQEFEHKSQAEMDQVLQESRQDWEKTERKRMDEEMVETILQQSVLEEEQKQLTLAMKESKDMIMKDKSGYNLYGMFAPEGQAFDSGPAASSSSGPEANNRDSRDYQYPESVYIVMSMGFPLEKCIQAYHLVGDNIDGILAYSCQTLGR